MSLPSSPTLPLTLTYAGLLQFTLLTLGLYYLVSGFVEIITYRNASTAGSYEEWTTLVRWVVVGVAMRIGGGNVNGGI